MIPSHILMVGFRIVALAGCFQGCGQVPVRPNCGLEGSA
jgi:hypothetical protein